MFQGKSTVILSTTKGTIFFYLFLISSEIINLGKKKKKRKVVETETFVKYNFPVLKRATLFNFLPFRSFIFRSIAVAAHYAHYVS